MDAFYSKLGEVPGVLVDKVGRQKILNDLGYVKPETKIEGNATEAALEETKGDEVSMVTQKALHEVEQSQVVPLRG